MDRPGAVTAFEQALADCTTYGELLSDHLRVLGPDHTETLTVRGNIAATRANTGDFAGATAVLASLLADQERVLGPDHPHTIATQINLAACRSGTGDWAGAAATYEQVVAQCLQC